MKNGSSIVLLTAPDSAEGSRISDILINEHLAGCVSKFPVESVFKWQSGIEHSAEILLVVKTRTSLSDLIIKRVKEIHSYDVPEIIVLPVAGGSAEYLKWIESETLS